MLCENILLVLIVWILGELVLVCMIKGNISTCKVLVVVVVLLHNHSVRPIKNFAISIRHDLINLLICLVWLAAIIPVFDWFK